MNFHFHLDFISTIEGKGFCSILLFTNIRFCLDSGIVKWYFYLFADYIICRIENQQERNQLLKTEIAKLDKQVAEIRELKKRRQQMLDRMQVIQSLQSNRPEIVKIFDEFVRSVPDGVYFEKMERKGSAISLVGYAESTNRVSALMRKLDAAEKFANPNLTVVEADETLGEQGSRFEMRVNLKTPQTDADTAEEGTGQGGA